MDYPLTVDLRTGQHEGAVVFPADRWDPDGHEVKVERIMVQAAPWPTELEELVRDFHYRPGWTFTLAHMNRGQGSVGLTLDITTKGFDSYHPEEGPNYGVHHFMPVPPAAFNRRSWARWLLEQCLQVERHEACEFARLGDDPTTGQRPWAPNHGPGNDPYVIWDYSTDDDRRTSFRGVTKPG